MTSNNVVDTVFDFGPSPLDFADNNNEDDVFLDPEDSSQSFGIQADENQHANSFDMPTLNGDIGINLIDMSWSSSFDSIDMQPMADEMVPLKEVDTYTAIHDHHYGKARVTFNEQVQVRYFYDQ